MVGILFSILFHLIYMGISQKNAISQKSSVHSSQNRSRLYLTSPNEKGKIGDDE